MRSDLFEGRYLFHLHTRFTDGKSSVIDYFEHARRSDIERLIFLEHIRSQPTYPVEKFAAEVMRCAASFLVRATVGFETKLLPDGDLDISPEHLAMADVVGIAEHSFPNDSDLLRKTFVGATDFVRSSFPEKTVVWVHPGLWFKRRGLVPQKQPDFLEMVRHALSKGVFLEKNLRYQLLSDTVACSLRAPALVIGADAHCVTDLQAG
jgi:histidinol phosphatase-like PHP family hydrolase